MRNVQSIVSVMCALLAVNPMMAQPPAAAQPPGMSPNNTASQNTRELQVANTGSTSSPGAPLYYGLYPQRQGGFFTRTSSRFRFNEITPVNLTNTGRLDSLIRAGRLYLSLQDAIALALENNLDIQLSRYGAQIAQADLLRAQAGGLLRGVPTAIRQGAQSALSQLTGNAGGAGSGQSQGGGGASSDGGVGGTVITQTGTAIPQYDEFFFANVGWGHSTRPQSNPFATGVTALTFDNTSYSFGFQKSFTPGTQVQLISSNSRVLSNSPRNDLNPFTNSNVSLQITQPLLQGFGVAVNTRNIRVAKNNQKVNDLVFKQQVIATVSSVVNLYADLVAFTEDVRVRRQALAYAEKLYNDNRKQVEIGTLAPIEIVKAEAEVAARQQDLTVSETQLLQQETIVKNALSKTGVQDPQLAAARIVLTDRLAVPTSEAIQPLQDLVEQALRLRPELEQTRINITNTSIALAGSRSQLLPSLNLVAGAQNNALAGQINGLPLLPGQPPRLADQAFLGGGGTLLNQIFGRKFPDYNVGVQLNIPLRNRTAIADVVRDQLSLRQAEINQQIQANSIRVNVSNAVVGLQQARARYAAAQKSRQLQEQSLDAEQKKYSLGASTIFFVIQSQRDLATAQGNEVAALANYNRAKVQLAVATGTLLEDYRVSLDEAAKGQVSRTSEPVVAPAGQP